MLHVFVCKTCMAKYLSITIGTVLLFILIFCCYCVIRCCVDALSLMSMTFFYCYLLCTYIFGIPVNLHQPLEPIMFFICVGSRTLRPNLLLLMCSFKHITVYCCFKGTINISFQIKNTLAVALVTSLNLFKAKFVT